MDPTQAERIAKALESIAASLERLAHPPVISARMDGLRPGPLTWVEHAPRRTMTRTEYTPSAKQEGG